ncbi:hypothetical protein [Streptomyces silvisoli]|uniref:Uncharacterized protein n=1 Tax=Streptomyces silvisoli TaxID=3034235 RepID=A0ABT5ZRY3_9ACTN|nr:hypothetical protein [Streptomyces silvisoli]MDF3292593.1 hypothetical protein [Streptomyces silvisoli]
MTKGVFARPGVARAGILAGHRAVHTTRDSSQADTVPTWMSA